ncbi:hypothetical protein L1D14_07765 [Vibrio tubiashii]|uniref:hypothetical protein n=1 Tax=Vibrio tubiashii TaxID=29498 RepID=UPI001EFDEFBA|nr:hypothetical protein [Vibrio tubiashii]MCG9576136.1 hypothetical protein [Vibrio tubiashii]
MKYRLSNKARINIFAICSSIIVVYAYLHSHEAAKSAENSIEPSNKILEQIGNENPTLADIKFTESFRAMFYEEKPISAPLPSCPENIPEPRIYLSLDEDGMERLSKSKNDSYEMIQVYAELPSDQSYSIHARVLGQPELIHKGISVLIGTYCVSNGS